MAYKRKKRKTTFQGKTMTKGERKVAIELTKLELKFTHDSTYPGLVNELGNKMRFDFIVYTPEGHVAVEYDGEQHFYPVSFGGDDDAAKIRFNRTQIGDRMKNQFCLANQIPILRIRYDDENVRRTILQYFAKMDIVVYGESLRTSKIVDIFYSKN